MKEFIMKEADSQVTGVSLYNVRSDDALVRYQLSCSLLCEDIFTQIV